MLLIGFVTIGLPTAGSATQAPETVEETIPPQYVAVEVPLKAASEGWIFIWAGTCRDRGSEARLKSADLYRRKLERQYERLSGRTVLSDIIIMEGDSCSNEKYFERNLRHQWKLLGEAKRALDGLRAGRREAASTAR